ncbi:MAG: hypothetical protein NC183_05180, partial [Corallococcus sp.]|nr:hypothetical protein [Corallococcus sp.]
IPLPPPHIVVKPFLQNTFKIFAVASRPKSIDKKNAHLQKRASVHLIYYLLPIKFLYFITNG